MLGISGRHLYLWVAFRNKVEGLPRSRLEEESNGLSSRAFSLLSLGCYRYGYFFYMDKAVLSECHIDKAPFLFPRPQEEPEVGDRLYGGAR